MTGRHAAGPWGDHARMLAEAAAGLTRRPPRRITYSQQRAMTLGRELDTLNRVRALRARTWPHKAWSPAGMAAWLMGTARLDARRRELRGQLRDALLVTGDVSRETGAGQ